MVFIWTLETTASLFSLVFNIAFFPEQCYFCASGCAVLYSHVIMVAIANAFPNIARLPYCLNIPSNSFQLKLVRQELTRKMDSNLSVFQWALLLVLCWCLKHLKIKAMSQSHSPIQFVLFTFHFDFWGTCNPYPQVQYYGICASLAYKKGVTRTHSNIKEWWGPVTLFTGGQFTFKNRVRRFFCFCTWDVFRLAVGLLGLFFAWPLLFLSFPIQFFVKGNKTSSIKNGKKNATSLETKFNITRQFISDTGFQVKANLNMTWCP